MDSSSSSSRRKMFKKNSAKINKKSAKIKKKSAKKWDDVVTLDIFERIILPKILPEGSTTIYATNLLCVPGRKIVKADFDEFFKHDGKVVNVEIKYHRKRDWQVDFAKIEFESHDAAKKALKDSDGRLFINTFAILNISLNPNKDIDRSYTKKFIHVCGFGDKTIESYKLRDYLKDHFSSCGEILSVRTPDNMKTGLSKGYAFIQFKDFESIPKALEKDGSQFMHCTLQVRKTKVNVTFSKLTTGM